ncbi:hypothetical protein [Maritalea mediterranea]|uniref:Uncharacterized protein n=1 Tax=Maritalea mediterranea TaxID=2909667 RepID=A0ABS9E913_9HYPH|nr:hypothetical protein [Maritalea mediterranea]MCF4097951.1 hypothetical protein [Maritalea mediterranea]
MPLATSHQFVTEDPDPNGSGLDPFYFSSEDEAKERIARYGLLGAVLNLLEPVMMRSEPLINGTAIERRKLEKFWVWLERDGAPKLIEGLKASILEKPTKTDHLVVSGFTQLVAPLERQYEAAEQNEETRRRLTIQLGGYEVYASFPLILAAFKHFEKLRAAVELALHIRQYNTEKEFSDLIDAVDLPSGEEQKLWCTALVNCMEQPDKFMRGVLDHCYGETEQTVRKSGYGPYGDAMVVNLQQMVDQIEDQAGIYSDVDLICLSISRFHRIARTLHYYLDLGKSSQWNHSIEILTGRVSKVLEKRLAEVVPHVTTVLHTSTQNAHALFTTDKVLQAYNSVYLLDAARGARESLAVNSIVDKSWTELGKSLEILLERAMVDQKAAPFGDSLAIAKVDIAIKLCAIRFGAEYAQIMMKKRDNIERRKLNPEAIDQKTPQ